MAHVPRVYVPGRLRPGPLTVTGDPARHLATVLRARPGESFLAFAGDGREWAATVTAVAKDRVSATVSEMTRMEPPPQPAVELWCALVRAQRFDLVVEKATELGADCIRPLVAKHAARGEEASANRLERWRRIAVEASEQCGRLSVPAVEPAATFDTLLARRGALLIADVSGKPWRSLQPLAPTTGTVTVAIGPEGGFAREEVQRATAAGALVVSLGANILRTETAAMLAVGLLRAG